MNLLKSIWNYKCPRCRQGSLYKEPFKLNKPLDMHETCEHCGLDFQPEPGYYFGAMFVSYIWTGWLCLFIIGVCMLGLGWSVEASFGLLLAVAGASYFLVLRLSRSIYIHLDKKFDQKYAE